MKTYRKRQKSRLNKKKLKSIRRGRTGSRKRQWGKKKKKEGIKKKMVHKPLIKTH